ncbi:BQ2448_5494 [Microbotryum intermedium]|uniref:BQ2448_5494 protein n=1 Tax=Microbotryum intermedium TaxID=269621 RepID=A0A238F792_9BASI|nr:BQ2448_5494 [Microbotryum intermedium]
MGKSTGFESLPIELIHRCIDLTRPNDPEQRRARHNIKRLVPLTLVAKRWTVYAQQCLFQNVMLIGPRDVEKFGDALAMIQGRFETNCLIIAGDVTRLAHRALTTSGLKADAKYAELIHRALNLTMGLQELRLAPKLIVAPAVLLLENLSHLRHLTLQCCFMTLEPGAELAARPTFHLESFTFIPAAGLTQSSLVNLTTMAFVEYVLSHSLAGSIKHIEWRHGYADLVAPQFADLQGTRSYPYLDNWTAANPGLEVVCQTLESFFFPACIQGPFQSMNTVFELGRICSLSPRLHTLSINSPELQLFTVISMPPPNLEVLILRQIISISDVLHMLQRYEDAMNNLRKIRTRLRGPERNEEDWVRLEQYCRSRGIELVHEEAQVEASAW